MENKSTIIIAFILLFVTLSSSLIAGYFIHAEGGYQNNVLFNADVRRVIHHLTDFDGDHRRTMVHPIFVLLLNPIGLILTTVIGSEATVALMLTAICGALGVLLFYLILIKKKLSQLHSIAFSLIFAFSPIYFLFRSAPEMFIFSTASLLFLLLTYTTLENKKFLKAFIPASVISIGITTTNALMVFILLIFKSGKTKIAKRILFTASCFLIIIATVAGLAGIQKAIYPSSIFFLNTEVYAFEASTFFKLDNIKQPIRVFKDKSPDFFLRNIIAPDTEVIKDDNGRVRIEKSKKQNLDVTERAAMVLYYLTILFSVYLLLQFKVYKDPLFMICVSYFLVTIIFHTFYVRAFLLSNQFTFALLLALAIPFSNASKTKVYALISVALLGFCTITIYKNIEFMISVINSLSA